MKKKLICTLFFLASINLNAQKLKIEWGEELPTTKEDYIDKILYADDENIYAYVERTKAIKFGIVGMTDQPISPGIIKFDKNAKYLSRKDYAAPEKHVIMKDMFYFGGQFVMLTHKDDRKANSIEINGTLIDKNSLNIKKESSRIWQIDYGKDDFSWTARASEEGSLLLFVGAFEQKKDENKKFAFKIVDQDLKTVQEKSVTLPYTLKEFTLFDYSINENGDVYVLGKLYDDGAKKEKAKGANNEQVASYTLLIMKYAKDGSKRDYKIEMGNKLLQDFELETDPDNGDLVLLGTYQSTDENGITGYFLNRVDATSGNVTLSKNYEFPLNLIQKANKVGEDKTSSKNPGISEYYTITDFIIEPDNSIYVILEKDHTVITTMKTIAYTTYYAESIIAIKLDKDGTQKWANLIPKRQFFNDLRAYIYYSKMIYNDKLYLFYNEIEKNVEYSLNSGEVPKKFNALDDMYLMMVEINDDGGMKKTVVETSDKAKTNFCIPNSEQIGENQFMIEGFDYKSKKYKYGIASFENRK